MCVNETVVGNYCFVFCFVFFLFFCKNKNDCSTKHREKRTCKWGQAWRCNAKRPLRPWDLPLAVVRRTLWSTLPVEIKKKTQKLSTYKTKAVCHCSLILANFCDHFIFGLCWQLRDLDLFILNPSSISDQFEPVTPRVKNGVSSGYSNFRVCGQKPMMWPFQ